MFTSVSLLSSVHIPFPFFFLFLLSTYLAMYICYTPYLRSLGLRGLRPRGGYCYGHAESSEHHRNSPLRYAHSANLRYVLDTFIGISRSRNLAPSLTARQRLVPDIPTCLAHYVPYLPTSYLLYLHSRLRLTPRRLLIPYRMGIAPTPLYTVALVP